MNALVLIPSYNTGPRLLATVEAALRSWDAVWVVVDGSTDGSEQPLLPLAATDSRLRVLPRARNGGKGAAIATGIDAALAAGYTHALTLDADGQHPTNLIPQFLAAAKAAPDAMILGRPVFGPEAPLARCQGRKLTIAMVRCEILGSGIDDPLFGFRVYPIAPLHRALKATRWARGFDFDQEVIVRMYWAGTPAINLPAPCRYLSKAEGGVSHFNYVRDNLLLIWLQLRLLGELLLWRWPAVWRLRRTRQGQRSLARAVVLLVALAAGSATAAKSFVASPDPALRAGDPGWMPLFAALARREDREAAFTEKRFFPFRRTPVTLTGEVRISPANGVSLAYLTPDVRTLIVDRSGLLFRDSRGRDQAAPDDPRVHQAAAAIVDILQFDLSRLWGRYEVHGSRAGAAWRLSFLPPPGQPAAAAGFSALVVEGEGDHPSRIELIYSPAQRIEIELADPRRLNAFPAADLIRYFRR